MHSDALTLAFVLDEPFAAQLMKSTLNHYGIKRATVADGTAQIRRKLVQGENQCVVACIALTERAIDRHGQALQKLRADRNGFSTQIRLVGLLTDAGVTPEVAQLGCDVYVQSLSQAANAIHLLTEECGARRAKLHQASRPRQETADRPLAHAWMRVTRHAQIHAARVQPHWLGTGRWSGTTRFGRRILRLPASGSGQDQGD